MFRRLKETFDRQSPTVKTFLILIVLLVIGIIIRWDAVMDGISAGFRFYSTNNNN